MALERYVIQNKKGSEIHILNYGATLARWICQDKAGNKSDILLGFDQDEDFVTQKHPHFGGVIGRNANRIAKGNIQIDGMNYQLEINNPPNHLHGGKISYDKKYWTLNQFQNNKVELSYLSPHLEQNYPGNLQIHLSYELTEENELILKYRATTDQTTLCNLTNHAYFDLSGHQDENIFQHEFQILSEHFLPTDSTSIPTGVIQSVQDTVFDFRENRRILREEMLAAPALSATKGYDHNFVFSNESKDVKAIVTHPHSGRKLVYRSDQAGMQFYLANNLNMDANSTLKKAYQAYAGFCLEAQNFPDAPHHNHFPSAILKPGEIYQQTTSYQLSCD